jgi:hypothetical protein
MPYQVTWEPPNGFYARFTGWVTPDAAEQLAHEMTTDPRYDSLQYAIVDFTDAPGHTFRRDDQIAIGNAMVELIGAGFSNSQVREIAVTTDSRMLNFLETYARLTPRPFRVFESLGAARRWLSGQSLSLRHLADS